MSMTKYVVITEEDNLELQADTFTRDRAGDVHFYSKDDNSVATIDGESFVGITRSTHGGIKEGSEQ